MPSNKKKYTFIDLFAGCGGLSEGFLQTGRFNALAHVEWEKPMVDTLRNRLVDKWGESINESKRKVILFDIQKTDELINGFWSEESNQKYGLHNADDVKKEGLKGLVGNQHVDLIIGGPPCQAYSIHGRATDKDSMQNDYRNYLFESFCNVVDAFRPDLFVFENVGGLLSAKPGGIPVRKRIYDAFTQIGYKIRTPEEMPTALYDAANFNVPQHRPRVIILGTRNDTELNLDDLYAAIDKEKNLKVKLTVRDALGQLPPLYPLAQPIKEGRYTRSHQKNPNPEITQHESRNHGPRERAIFKEWVENNMNHISHQAMIDYYFEKTGHKTLYQKYKSLEWDKPSPTMTTQCTGLGNGRFGHPEQDRAISVREAALLQTFPVFYKFFPNEESVSITKASRYIGNAVPPILGEIIAQSVINYVKNLQHNEKEQKTR